MTRAATAAARSYSSQARTASPADFKVGGQLRCDRVDVLVVAELERLRYSPVEHATSGLRDLVVCDLADAVVAEVVPVEPLLPDDAPPPELIETLHEIGLLEVGGRCEDVDVEIAPDRGGELDDALGRRRELTEPGLDDGPHPCRHASRWRPTPCSSWGSRFRRCRPAPLVSSR